jgi:hypothetical protein
VLRLVTIDLANADLAAFKHYEGVVLALVPSYGGRESCVFGRSTDGRPRPFPGAQNRQIDRSVYGLTCERPQTSNVG